MDIKRLILYAALAFVVFTLWGHWQNDYVKDKLTNRMVAAPTRRTCENYGGFVCKVRHCDSQHYS